MDLDHSYQVLASIYANLRCWCKFLYSLCSSVKQHRYLSMETRSILILMFMILEKTVTRLCIVIQKMDYNSTLVEEALKSKFQWKVVHGKNVTLKFTYHWFWIFKRIMVTIWRISLTLVFLYWSIMEIRIIRIIGEEQKHGLELLFGIIKKILIQRSINTGFMIRTLWRVRWKTTKISHF